MITWIWYRKAEKQKAKKSKGRKSEGGMLPRVRAHSGSLGASFGLFQDRELSGRRLQGFTV
jgi:hypothetical protein